MPTQKLTQNNFTSGQYDRAVQGKEQSELVASGLAKAMNVVSSESGELRKRLGTKFLMEFDSAKVLVPYRYNDNDLILVFGDKTLDVLEYTDGGVKYYAGKEQEQIPTAWTSNTDNDYVLKSSSAYRSTVYKAFNGPVQADFPDNRLNGWEYNGTTVLKDTMTVDVQFPEPSILGKVAVNFAVGWNYGDTPAQPYIGYTNAFLQYSDDGENWTSVKCALVSAIGNTPYYHWLYTQDTSVQHREMRITYDILLAQPVESHTYWRITFKDKLEQGGNASFEEPRRLHIEAFNLVEGEYSQIETEISELKNIKYAQDETLMKVVDGKTQPINISHESKIECGKWAPLAPKDLFTTYGVPTSVQYFQNRLWFSGFSSFPTTVLASKFNDESKFTVESTAKYDDRLELKSNQLSSKIVNMIGGQRVLYCMSQDGVSCIDGGSTGLLATNQNIEFVLRNRMPSGDSAPVYKDDVLLYGSADGTKLYSLDFDLLVDRFQVDDIAKYAKEVVSSKITELQYANNESKYIYGLTEKDSFFALLYQKGGIQGWYPLSTQNGTVYDISVIKHGRDYKLLMVVSRGGKWFLEEKLDKGSYKATDDPLMSAEDKKWATYDNLENNIALDCYRSYDNGFSAQINLESDSIVTDLDLTEYVGHTLMLGSSTSKDFVLCVVGTRLENGYKTEVVARRGESLYFDMVYPSFSYFEVDLGAGTDSIGVISQGRYLGEFKPDNGVITLPFPVHKVIYGALYESYGIIKMQKPYESMKSVQQINISVIDTAHLQVGTGFNDLQELEQIKDDSHYDLTNITMNGSYRVVPSDTPEWDKYIILRSVKGLPFTVVGVEAFVNYSNMGGN